MDPLLAVLIGVISTLIVAAGAYMVGARQNAILLVQGLNALIRILSPTTSDRVDLRKYFGTIGIDFFRTQREFIKIIAKGSSTVTADLTVGDEKTKDGNSK